MDKRILIGIGLLLGVICFQCLDRQKLIDVSINHISWLINYSHSLPSNMNKLIHLVIKLLSELGDKFGIGGAIVFSMSTMR
jgi:hypothetical protein